MSGWARRLPLVAVATFAPTLFGTVIGPAPVFAQTQAPLQGLVADELTGEVIASARVTIVGKGMETRTSDAGTFAFADPPAGIVSVRVEADGYPVTIDEVEVVPDEMVFVHIVLPQVQFVLNEILVTGSATRPQPEVRGAATAKTAADLVALQVPGVGRSADPARRIESPIRLRGNNSIVLSGDPIFFLDGQRMIGTMTEVIDALRRIPAERVRRIRVLRGPSAAFIQGSANGAIIVETKVAPER